MTIKEYDALVLGSGAAGLAAAVRLSAEGVENFALITEGLHCGASINTGSDKQTYYKLGLSGSSKDSVRDMVSSYLVGGSADGDLALVEAATSTRAFFHLVNLGAPFPCDQFGEYCGYKTDHDPARRATSCGPYTSREMCRALIREVKRLNLNVFEERVIVKLLTRELTEEEARARESVDLNLSDAPRKQIVGAIVINCKTHELEVYRANYIVFAVGGPGGLYQTSVYPQGHMGAIGLALEIGALAKGLPESQFGMASFTDLTQRALRVENPSGIKEFRWNVSGSYMQTIPAFISTEPDGQSDRREFLNEYFHDTQDLFGKVFLKGYQWPFDARKALNGSSFIDLCVFYETNVRKRRVFLDYTRNPQGFDMAILPEEARVYLTNSNALGATPFERLQKMNPGAIELYRDWGLDLAQEPLEIAVCAQHNNGGLAVDIWWRSLNISGLYPIGEVAGTHGVARPGGTALNAGQVGAFRAALDIARRLRSHKRHDAGASDEFDFHALVDLEATKLASLSEAPSPSHKDWQGERVEFRERMSRYGGIFRSVEGLQNARADAKAQVDRLLQRGANDSVDWRSKDWDYDTWERLRTLQLALAHLAYLDAIYAQSLARVGSRGSSLTLTHDGEVISERFPDSWRALPEDVAYREKILYSYCVFRHDVKEATQNFWRRAKPLPNPDDWFENVWREFRTINQLD
ncbi:MAG: FAD-binding protein [Planctomycetia bacterium]|nr:FAD-binding protein [Planctomycetia bacterium]